MSPFVRRGDIIKMSNTVRISFLSKQTWCNIEHFWKWRGRGSAHHFKNVGWLGWDLSDIFGRVRWGSVAHFCKEILQYLLFKIAFIPIYPNNPV